MGYIVTVVIRRRGQSIESSHLDIQRAHSAWAGPSPAMLLCRTSSLLVIDPCCRLQLATTEVVSSLMKRDPRSREWLVQAASDPEAKV